MKMNWKLLKQIAGIILIIVGFVALVTPFTPGAWLIFVGAELAGIGILSRERMKVYWQKVRYWWWWKKREKDDTTEQTG